MLAARSSCCTSGEFAGRFCWMTATGAFRLMHRRPLLLSCLQTRLRLLPRLARQALSPGTSCEAWSFPSCSATRGTSSASAQQDSCSFADLAFSVGLTVDGASTLRKQMASFITQQLKTQWLLSMFRESKVAVDGKQLSDAAAKVVKPGHPLTLFLVHVFSLLQHVDVYISSPVWDGAPLPADQIRRFHAKWKVAASEVLSEQKSPPKKMLLAHVSRHNPLSSSKRDVYVQTAFVEVCPAPR
jgi:hypothetical protein